MECLVMCPAISELVSFKHLTGPKGGGKKIDGPKLGQKCALHTTGVRENVG